MIFREIPFCSDDFWRERQLRDEVLRVPLGLSIREEDFETERDQMHFGLFDSGGEIVACAIAVPVSSAAAKIRQMVVRPHYQGSGHGRGMMRRLEEELARRGFLHLWLNARLGAVLFYEKMGYRKAGAEFIEIGIPHLKMEKDIPPAADNLIAT